VQEQAQEQATAPESAVETDGVADALAYIAADGAADGDGQAATAAPAAADQAQPSSDAPKADEGVAALYARLAAQDKQLRELKADRKADAGGGLDDLIRGNPQRALELALEALGGADDAEPAQEQPSIAAKELAEIRAELAALKAAREQDLAQLTLAQTASALSRALTGDTSDRWEITRELGQEAVSVAVEVARNARAQGEELPLEDVLDAVEAEYVKSFQSASKLTKLAKVAKLLGVTSAQQAGKPKATASAPSLQSGGSESDTGTGDPVQDALEFLRRESAAG